MSRALRMCLSKRTAILCLPWKMKKTKRGLFNDICEASQGIFHVFFQNLHVFVPLTNQTDKLFHKIRDTDEEGRFNFICENILSMPHVILSMKVHNIIADLYSWPSHVQKKHYKRKPI